MTWFQYELTFIDVFPLIFHVFQDCCPQETYNTHQCSFVCRNSFKITIHDQHPSNFNTRHPSWCLNTIAVYFCFSIAEDQMYGKSTYIYHQKSAQALALLKMFRTWYIWYEPLNGGLMVMHTMVERNKRTLNKSKPKIGKYTIDRMCMRLIFRPWYHPSTRCVCFEFG